MKMEIQINGILPAKCGKQALVGRVPATVFYYGFGEHVSQCRQVNASLKLKRVKELRLAGRDGSRGELVDKTGTGCIRLRYLPEQVS